MIRAGLPQLPYIWEDRGPNLPRLARGVGRLPPGYGFGRAEAVEYREWKAGRGPRPAWIAPEVEP